MTRYQIYRIVKFGQNVEELYDADGFNDVNEAYRTASKWTNTDKKYPHIYQVREYNEQ